MAPYTWPMGFLIWFAVSVRPQEVLPAGAKGGWRAPKTSDIDLQTCIANFNVHKDKIIRTQDSQNMGARYLNEADLGSREECLRLCCETDDCDVFVFEQNAGSCYLFQCGPPEDFKCKFTHHVNYSSAVLAVSRHAPDLENQIKLTKHVQELAKLRAKPDLEAPRPITSTTPLPALVAQETEQARRCSRYQFECRSNGECIAIYNACDGIPQCADGSDEAAELGCPALEAPPAQNTTPPRRTPFPILPLPPAVLKYGREGELVQQQQQQQLPTQQQQQKPAIYSNPYQDADVVRPPVRMFDPVGGASWGTNWGAPVPQLPQYQEVRRQGDAPVLPAQLHYPEYQGRPANYYADRQPESWPAERYAHQSGYGGLEGAAPAATKPQESATGLHDQQQLAHDLQHSKEGAQASRVVVKVAPRPQYAEPYKMAVEDTQDGQAHIPRGAILSLTIGLVLTAVMAILIGCRLRVVRRRLRKGENGYAHDADYLVNGMYL